MAYSYSNKVKFGRVGFSPRATRRLYIVNGSEPVTAVKQQAFLPVVTTTLESGLNFSPSDVVKSADAIVRTAEGWIKPNAGVKTTQPSAGRQPVYFATADSTDFDVEAVGKLGAIYAGDKFEVQTPFFDAAQTYNSGDKLYLVPNTNTDAGNTPGAGVMISNTVPSAETIGAGKYGIYPVVGIVSKGVVRFANTVDANGVYAPVDKMDVAVNVPAGTNSVAGGPRNWANDTQSTSVLQFYTVSEDDFIVTGA